MGTFLDDAKAAQEEKREKDPADMGGSKDPWATNDAGDGGGSASDSASGNAGDSADENEHQEPPEPKAPKAKAAPTRTPELRRGRPKGPARRAVTARILVKNDRMLTKAVQVTGKIPQTIFDEALEAYFKRLKIEDPGEEFGASEDFDVA
ncbi:hypothetical protein ACOKM5_44320 [Streptomyces sp. BH097]|uniref:hypothetical protein n=1 Tax=Streptomyces sp. BH097 TaxID=3410406 RepID=UPI003CED1AE2